MPLNSTALATAIMAELGITAATQPDAADAWLKIADTIITHITENAEVQVVGITPGGSTTTGTVT